jgi:hypothetical protein
VEPLLPREAFRLVEFVDEVEQQAPILPVEILDAEAALLFRQQNFVPSD